jgi:dTDP-4-amino-4,6-dideoxygalactose transaminase
MLRIDESAAGVTRGVFVKALNAEGVPAGAGYLPSCVYEYDMFRNLSGFEGTKQPFDSPYYGKSIEYGKGLCPVAEQVLETAVRLDVSEFYTERDLAETVAAIRKVSAHYAAK